MRKTIRRLWAFVLVLGLVGSAGAQPAAPAASGGSDKDKKDAPGEDAKLYSCAKTPKAVDVSFKPEIELKEILTWVMGFTCKNFILDPRIVSTGKKVTIIAPNRMSPREAYRVFLVALSTMGLTIVPKGSVLRIVEAATAKSETVPIYKNGVPADEDQMVRYILRPSYAQTEALRAALDSVRSPAGQVQAAGTMIIITDYASQVRDMMSLAKAIDVPGNSDGVYTISVLHSDANALAQKLNEILGITGGAAGGSKPSGRAVPPPPPGTPAVNPAIPVEDVSAAVPSKIVVDDRTNTLVVVSSEAGYRRVKALVERLDISLDAEGGAAIRVYRLENALAKDLAATLNNAVGQGTQTRGSGAAGGRPGQPAAPAAMPPPSGPAGDLGAALEGQVRIVNDDPTNSLIVTSSSRDYLAIKDVVRRLDQPRRQIYIEALILEVTMNKGLDLGTSSHGGLPVADGSALVLGGVQTTNLKSLNPLSLGTLTGLIGGLVGSPLSRSQEFLGTGTSIPSYGVLFQALATQDNTNILSAPHVTAIDNEKAEFSVGNNIPFPATSFGGLGGLGAAGAAGAGAAGLPLGSIGQNIQREKLTLDLNVTPHISSNDSVRLEIEQNTKDLGGKDPQLGPTWSERKLKTQVVVHDQESVVIGGLMQEREATNVTKVPLLGDIPLLGYLFKYSTRQKKKTNLLILLTPYIIRDQLDLQSIRERKSREYREFTASFANLSSAKFEPTIDYRHKRGLLEDINRTLQTVEEEQGLLDAAGRRQRVNEGAVDYAPSTIEEPEDGHGTGAAPQAPRSEHRDSKPAEQGSAGDATRGDAKGAASADTNVGDAKGADTKSAADGSEKDNSTAPTDNSTKKSTGKGTKRNAIKKAAKDR